MPISVTDQQISAMTADERRALIQRLARPVEELIPASNVTRMRTLRLTLMIAGTVALIPWIGYLGFSLPAEYAADNWGATWIGFDVMLVLLMGATAVLGWQRRQLVVLTAFATGVLLVADAWFDIMTATADDRWVSLATAFLAELPLAYVLISGTLRLIRLMANRFWFLDEGASLWELRIPLAGQDVRGGNKGLQR